MKKRVLTYAYPLFIFLMVLLVLSCSNERESFVGEILYMEGSVSVNGRAGEIGLEVISGDVIVTGPDSYAEIGFGNSSILKAEENTNLVLNAEEKTFKLVSGALAVLQSKARWLTGKKSWLVETPSMIAAVRGTVYYTKVESPDSVYFCLCNGEIHLEDTDVGDALNLEATHHNAVRFIRTSEGIVYKKAPMVYHADEDLERMAARVNKTIDWN